MKKNGWFILMTCLLCVFLVSCSTKDKSDETTNTKASEIVNRSSESKRSTTENPVTIESTTTSLTTSDNSVTTESSTATPSSNELTEAVSSTTEETKNVKLDGYDRLPLTVKIQLIAGVVDERAYPVEGKSLKERGLGITYYAYADYVILQIGSGAGVGHPTFLIDYDSKTVTPREGVVGISASEYEMVNTINLSPVSKETLYDNYLENKDAYDRGMTDVYEQEIITEVFEKQKEIALNS